MSKPIIYCVGGVEGTVQDFARKANGINIATMRGRLKSYTNGKMTEAELFAPVGELAKVGGNDEWLALADTPRTMNLGKIPGPSRFERALLQGN